jgi:voltage-gated potassium channel
VLFTCSVVTFSFILRVVELPFEQYNKVNPAYKDNLTDYGSSIWLTVITMTTVGYGDIYPHTIFGQMTAIFIALWGTFVISLLIMVTA